MKQRKSHRQVRRREKEWSLDRRLMAWSKLLAVGHDDKAASAMIDFAHMTQTKLLNDKHVPGLPFGGDAARLNLHKQLRLRRGVA